MHADSISHHALHKIAKGPPTGRGEKRDRQETERKKRPRAQKNSQQEQFI